MCNRYSSTKNDAKLQLRRTAIALANLMVRYNIAPQNRVPVVALQGERLVSREMTWGMQGFENRLVTNGKSETARHKPLFRNAWAQRRCVIPADGFYEWKTEGRAKLPYRFVRQDDALFWFAGLWEEHPVPGDDAPIKERFVILTRAANNDVQRLHDRMPLILTSGEIEAWLSPETSREWVPNGIGEGTLRSYRVSSAVSTPGYETPECIEPLKGVLEQTELW